MIYETLYVNALQTHTASHELEMIHFANILERYECSLTQYKKKIKSGVFRDLDQNCPFLSFSHKSSSRCYIDKNLCTWKDTILDTDLDKSADCIANKIEILTNVSVRKSSLIFPFEKESTVCHVMFPWTLFSLLNIYSMYSYFWQKRTSNFKN